MNQATTLCTGVLLLVAMLGATADLRADVRATITVPGDQGTIQEALDVSSNGDTIVVSAGTYHENIVFPVKSVTLRSSGPSNPGVVASTIIDGGGAGSVVTFANGATLDAKIDGFTLRNGVASSGGGVNASVCSPTIRRCVISGNSADNGGGIRVWNGSPLIDRCTIIDNVAVDSGGGVHCAYGPTGATPRITDCIVTGNEVTGDWAYGGGVSVDDIDVEINDTEISGNAAGSGAASGGEGGGVYGVTSGSNQITITGGEVTGNSASGGQSFGGGIRGLWLDVSVTGCDISGNTATGGDFGGGGGVYCDDGNLEISDCEITGNSGLGGMSYSDGGGGVFAWCGTVTITDCIIADNDVTASGGGVNLYSEWCYPAIDATIANCLIVNNEAGGGGGLMMSYGGALDIRDSLVAWNAAAYDGGGMYVSDGEATVTTCTVAMNSADPDFGGGGGIAVEGGMLQFNNGILWGDAALPDFGSELYLFQSTVDVSYSDVAGGDAGVYIGDTSTLNWLAGNLDVDPAFVEPEGPDGNGATWADNDFHLENISPCINAGDPTFAPGGATDFDGESRVQGCRVDMGVDEFADPTNGDFIRDGDVDLVDFAAFQRCFGQISGEPDADDECFCAFDVDASAVIDLPDLAVFGPMTGP